MLICQMKNFDILAFCCDFKLTFYVKYSKINTCKNAVFKKLAAL